MSRAAYLVLENGTVFEGKAFGAEKETMGELVFTTAMTGYLETLTDPSYFGQVVLHTFPLIGNYGVIPADFGWSDIGTWGSLYTHLEKNENVNASVGGKVVFDKSSGCVVNLPADHNAIIEGLDGYLVAYNNKNLIVCKLDDEQEIKNLVEKLK